MLSTYNFYRKNKLTISWVLLISFILFIVFNFSTSTTNAQQTTEQITVSCAPNKKVVQRNENVTFVATVKNATEKIKYSWSGVTIKSVDSPRVTTSYASLGEKKATVTIVTGTKRIKAECSVVVSTNVSIQNQTGGQQGGNNPLQNLGGLQQMLGGGNNPLGGLTGGQQGGQQGGNNPIGNILGGQQTNGIANTGTGTRAGTPTQNLNTRTSDTATNSQNARNNRRQEYQRELKENESEYEEDVKKCEEDKSDATQQGAEPPAEDIQQETQQMVPTNPIPIVDPIKNIRENIERLTLKDIGLEGSSQPSLDKTEACKVDAAIKKMAKDSHTFLTKGRDGNPYFVTNYENLTNDSQDIGQKNFIESIKNAQSCKENENTNIARALEKVPRSIIGGTSETASCPLEKENSDDLNELENFLSYIENPPAYKLAESYSAMLGVRLDTTERALYETSINRGFIGVKDDKGTIKNPPEIYLGHNINNMNSITNRVSTLDEVGEGKILLEGFMKELAL